MTDLILVALGASLASWPLFALGRWYEKRTPAGRLKRRLETIVVVNGGDAVYLRHLAALDEKVAVRLANRILDGAKFNGPTLESRHHKGGFLSPAEFRKVRDELVARRMADRISGNQITLRPPAFAMFRMLAGRRSERATGK